MSETELQRLALVGVGPHSRSLKFLNNKNNIADKVLAKQLEAIERQKLSRLNVVEHERINAKHFMKHVRNLEQDSQEVKDLLQRDDFESITPPPPRLPRDRKHRKIRMAQTAPAHMKHKSGQSMAGRTGVDRKQVKSGPETQEEKNKMLQTDRKKSVYLQLGGMGRSRHDSDDDSPRKVTLPKPNPKTLLDVMIGLNAFSHVPAPTCNSADFQDESRPETRSTFFSRDSIYDSSENIATKFFTNWRKNVASRKESIFQKLENKEKEQRMFFQRSESIATSCIPEETSSSRQSLFRKRKSKWTVRHSMRQPTLPAIDDEDERMESFLQYIKDAKEKEKVDVHPAFANSGLDKTSQRRKSFVNWLTERQSKPKAEDDDDDDDDEFHEGDLTYKGVSLVHKDVDFKPTEIGDLMKTILKIKTSFRDPLESRVKKFIKEIDKIKERDEQSQRRLSVKERRRRWIALTKGIDAALAESSDEDDYY